MSRSGIAFLFFFNDTPTTEIYTLSLHDALPISEYRAPYREAFGRRPDRGGDRGLDQSPDAARPELRRSEEHTSELQSLTNLVCRLLLEKKKRQDWLALVYCARLSTSLMSISRPW